MPWRRALLLLLKFFIIRRETSAPFFWLRLVHRNVSSAPSNSDLLFLPKLCVGRRSVLWAPSMKWLSQNQWWLSTNKASDAYFWMHSSTDVRDTNISWRFAWFPHPRKSRRNQSTVSTLTRKSVRNWWTYLTAKLCRQDAVFGVPNSLNSVQIRAAKPVSSFRCGGAQGAWSRADHFNHNTIIFLAHLAKRYY